MPRNPENFRVDRSIASEAVARFTSAFPVIQEKINQTNSQEGFSVGLSVRVGPSTESSTDNQKLPYGTLTATKDVDTGGIRLGIFHPNGSSLLEVSGTDDGFQILEGNERLAKGVMLVLFDQGGEFRDNVIDGNFRSVDSSEIAA